jgi:hypothetical protein
MGTVPSQKPSSLTGSRSLTVSRACRGCTAKAKGMRNASASYAYAYRVNSYLVETGEGGEERDFDSLAVLVEMRDIGRVHKNQRLHRSCVPRPHHSCTTSRPLVSASLLLPYRHAQGTMGGAVTLPCGVAKAAHVGSLSLEAAGGGQDQAPAGSRLVDQQRHSLAGLAVDLRGRSWRQIYSY